MAGRVFVLTDGAYSDCTIRRVVTDESVAQRLVRVLGWDVEEFAVDDVDVSGWPDKELWQVRVLPRRGKDGEVHASHPHDIPGETSGDWQESGWDAVARESLAGTDQWGRPRRPDEWSPRAERTDWFTTKEEALASGRIKLAEMRLQLAAMERR